MSIVNVTEKEQQLVSMLRKTGEALDACRAELNTLKSLIADTHTARGRYHTQMAWATLYEARGLPFAKPVSGLK